MMITVGNRMLNKPSTNGRIIPLEATVEAMGILPTLAAQAFGA